MKVNVLINTNKLTLDDIDPHETVETIRDIIYDKFKDVSAPNHDNPLAHTYLTTNHLRLLYKGKQLPKLSTLSEHNFKDGDTVLLFISQKQQEEPQDDKNEIMHSTIGDEEKSLKYTLKIKNDGHVKDAPDAEILEELGEGELKDLLQRLPNDIQEDVTVLPPKFDRETALPKKKAKKISTTFPPSVEGTVRSSGSNPPPATRVQPLTVESFSPVNSIYFESPVRVKFSQPMVPVAEHDKLKDSFAVPVTINPEVEGSWRWEDPFTALFTPKNPYPKSTIFFCYVKGEITSAIGGTMRDPVEWNFSTASLAFSGRRISFSGPRIQVLITFNQPIVFDKVHKSLIVVTDDDEILDIRPLELGKHDADIHFELKKAMETAKAGEYFAFEIEDDINGIGKANSKPIGVEVALSPYLLDLEKKLSFKFKTVASLQVLPVPKIDRSGNPVKWLLNGNLSVNFNNPLLATVSSSDLAKYVTTVPEIPEMKLSIFGATISISGPLKPKDYKVTLCTDIVDIHGQNLEKPATVTFPVSAPTVPYLGVARENTGFGFGWGGGSSSNEFITLDPSLPPVLHFTTRNVRSITARAYAVSPVQHHFLFSEFSKGKGEVPNFLHELWRQNIDVTAPKDGESGEKAWYLDARTTLDLAKAFGCDDLNQCGNSKESQIVLVVRASDTVEYEKEPLLSKLWLTWSDVGIAYVADEQSIYGWTYSLLTGDLVNGNMFLCTSSNVTLPLEKVKDAKVGGSFVSAKGQDDTTYKFLAAEVGRRSALINVQNMFNKSVKSNLVWHVIDDRSKYRPFDRVNIKGIIRQRDLNTGKILLPSKEISKISYTVSDARSKQVINSTEVELKSSYCFSFDFELPGTINLGPAMIAIKWGNEMHHHSVDVQEYKRKPFEMVLRRDKTTARPQEPLFLTAYAQAFTGEVLSGTSASWKVSVHSASYVPPNLGTYKFGIPSSSSEDLYTWESEINYTGKHNIAVSIDDILVPVVVAVGCTVKDSATNEQVYSSERTIIHPTTAYVGIKAEHEVVNVGSPYKFFAVTCDPKGNFTGDCSLHMYVRGTPFETYDGENTPPEIAVADSVLTPSDAGPIEFSFDPKFRGKYSLTLVSTDLDGRTSSASTHFWVYGAQSEAERDYQNVKEKEKNKANTKVLLPHYKMRSESVTLKLDRTDGTYEPGSTAELLVVSPFYPAQGTLCLHKNENVIKIDQFSVTDAMTRLPINILEEYLPIVNISVMLTGIQSRPPVVVENDKEASEPTTKKPRTEEGIESKAPVYSWGTSFIRISHEHKKLSLEVVPTKERDGPYLPGEEVSVDINVKDPNGKPITDAEVAVVVVDEAVLAITGYYLGDPRELFYTKSVSHINIGTNHNDILLTRVLPMLTKRPLPADEGTITIMYFSGRILRFETPNSISVFKLKSLIQERDGLPPATQRLLFKGKQLTDEKTLADQGVPNGACINLVLRLFGGGIDDDEKNMNDNAPPPIRIRTNMNALAYFGPHLKTESGKATAKFTLPDSLTKYRIMAIANTIDQFGAGEAQIIASLPLMIRQAPPRFLNYGDSCIMPVVVQNECDKETEVVVGIRGVNVDIATRGWKLKIPARGRTAVPFHITPKGPGFASFQVAASDSKLITSDAAQFKFPVQIPTTSETIASTGVMDGDNVMEQPIAKFTADNVVASAGGLEVSLASTVFQELTDAALYSIKYPYECTEQISSRVISMVAFKDMLPLLHRSKAHGNDPVPTPATIDAKVKEAINTILERRDSTGNFGYWKKDSNTYDYSSVYAYLALGFAKNNGFEVPASAITLAKTFLTAIICKYTQKEVKEEKQEDTSDGKTSRTFRWLRRQTQDLIITQKQDEYELEEKHGLACFAMYVFNIIFPASGKSDMASTMMSRKSLDKMPIEQIAWLLPTILQNKPTLKTTHKKVWEYINNRVTQTTTTAHFVHNTDYTSGGLLLRSDVRHDAVILSTLMETDPKSPLIVKLVRGMMSLRKNGSWYNTQDNSFALMAMNKYFNLFEKDFNYYVADLWIGNGHAAHVEFDGISTDTKTVQVPMSHLIQEESNITLAKRGQGRMYYRLAVDYSPKALFLPPRDFGFKISRTYKSLNQKEDVVVTDDEQGRKMCVIKAGTHVRVKVKMIADSVRSYVALVDHLPGGLEPRNTSITAGGTHTGYSFIHRFWNHQNIRDSRVEVFVDTLYPGKYVFSYIAQALTKGTFVVPPTKAEEMYSPEVFGRSDMLVVQVR